MRLHKELRVIGRAGTDLLVERGHVGVPHEGGGALAEAVDPVAFPHHDLQRRQDGELDARSGGQQVNRPLPPGSGNAVSEVRGQRSCRVRAHQPVGCSDYSNALLSKALL